MSRLLRAERQLATPELFWNVKMFGARGDNTTDDTAAIQAAIDVAEATTPATVYIPAGIYIVEFLTVEASGVRILLDPEATLKQKAGSYNIGSASTGIITVQGTSMASIRRVFIEGGVFDGNKANVTNSGNQFNLECVSFRFAEDCHAINVRTVDAFSDGFDWDFSANCSAVGCYSETAGGWGFHPSLESERIRLIDCDAINCGDDLTRGGFDQWEGGGQDATDCTYIRCRAIDCYRNFNIQSTGAQVTDLRSEGTTTAADVFTGANLPRVARVNTSEQTASASYTDLTTAGPATTVMVGATGILFVSVSARFNNTTNGAGAVMSFVLSGANTLAAADDYAAGAYAATSGFTTDTGRTVMLTGQTPGATVVTAKYRRLAAGSGIFANREVSAWSPQ